MKTSIYLLNQRFESLLNAHNDFTGKVNKILTDDQNTINQHAERINDIQDRLGKLNGAFDKILDTFRDIQSAVRNGEV